MSNRIGLSCRSLISWIMTIATILVMLGCGSSPHKGRLSNVVRRFHPRDLVAGVPCLTITNLEVTGYLYEGVRGRRTFTFQVVAPSNTNVCQTLQQRMKMCLYAKDRSVSVWQQEDYVQSFGQTVVEYSICKYGLRDGTHLGEIGFWVFGSETADESGCILDITETLPSPMPPRSEEHYTMVASMTPSKDERSLISWRHVERRVKRVLLEAGINSDIMKGVHWMILVPDEYVEEATQVLQRDSREAGYSLRFPVLATR